VTPAAFNISGAGFHQSCFEDDWGLGESPMAVAEAYLHAFEHALQARGVPYAYVGGESLETSVRGAQWIVAALAGGVKPAFLSALRREQQRGVLVTVGPKIPDRDGAMQRLLDPPVQGDLELEPLQERADVERLVSRRIDELRLPCFTASPQHVYVTVHEGDEGPRLVFVMNPTREKRQAEISVPGVTRLRDTLLVSPDLQRAHGAFALELQPRQVRIFEVCGRTLAGA
jgi:beta-galactosidase